MNKAIQDLRDKVIIPAWNWVNDYTCLSWVSPGDRFWTELDEVFTTRLRMWKEAKKALLPELLGGSWCRGSYGDIWQPDSRNYKTKWTRYTLGRDDSGRPATIVEEIITSSIDGGDEEPVTKWAELRYNWEPPKLLATWDTGKPERETSTWETFLTARMAAEVAKTIIRRRRAAAESGLGDWQTPAQKYKGTGLHTWCSRILDKAMERPKEEWEK